MRRRPNLKRAGLAAVGVAIAALAIVAIAGGGSNTPRTASTPRTAAVTTPASNAPVAASGPALTLAEYRKQANAICSSVSFTTPSATESLQQAAPVIAGDAAELGTALGRLRALRPSSEIASQVNDALGITEQAVEAGGQIAGAAQASDRAGARSAYEQFEGLAVAEHGIWKQIGVTQC